MKTLRALPLPLCFAAALAAVAPAPAAASPRGPGAEGATSRVVAPCIRKIIVLLAALPAELHRLASVCGGSRCGRRLSGYQNVGIGTSPPYLSSPTSATQPYDITAQDTVVANAKMALANVNVVGKELVSITYFAHTTPPFRVTGVAQFAICGLEAETK